MDFGIKFDSGLPYETFLDRYAKDGERERWNAVYDDVSLTEAQQELLEGFVREMKVLVLAGTWCGDCVNQCPIFARFAEASPRVRLHFFDRDEHEDLAEELQTCGAPRVPSLVFLSEDNFVCGRYGDRTLAKYRHMAANLSGTSGPPPEQDSLLKTVVVEWIREFERIQLMLRTSGRLRQWHGD